jgi:Spy/CpxP family protein refolding chaperone
MLKELAMFSPRISAVAVAGALLAGPVEAGQGRTHKWWQSEQVKAELALTPEQSAQVEQIFQAAMPKLKATKTELDRLEAELSKTIADGGVDEAQVTLKIDRVEATRSELGKLRALMLYRVHRVLSPDQRVKLKALNARSERNRDRGGANRKP